MEQKNPLRYILALAVALVPLLYLTTQWNAMPDTVPVHFGLDGKPDDWGNKSFTAMSSVFMAFISMLVYIMVVSAHKLDKKRLKGIKPSNFDMIAMATVVFIAIINLVVIVNTIEPNVVLLDKVLIPVIGLFFVFIGNVTYNVKQNRFVGVRTYWTLQDEDNWKHTNRLGGKLFFVAGILITLVGLFSKIWVAVLFTLIISILIAGVTINYSRQFYLKNKKENI